MMVPVVTEVCWPQGAHSQVHASVCSGQARPVPQVGQTKSSGQRAANRYRTQAASSGKRLWNSIRECGKSDMSGPGRAYVLSLFYNPPTFFTTANGGPGRTGISLWREMIQHASELLLQHAVLKSRVSGDSAHAKQNSPARGSWWPWRRD